MGFSALPTELVRAIFEQLFHNGWLNFLSLENALSLRLVCKQFDFQVKHYGLGSIRIPAEPHMPWRRVNDRLLTVILQQKVSMLQENDSELVNRVRETTNAVGSLRGVSGKSCDAAQDKTVEILCIVAVSNLAQWRVFQLTSYNEVVGMLSPAAATGNISLMKALLKSGAAVNANDRIFGNPLNAAAIGGHEAAVKLLIENGANMEYLKSAESGTALCHASRYGRDNIARLLLEKGAKLAFDPQQRQAIHHAMANGGHESVVKVLMGNGAHVNARTGRGETALHYAVSIGARKTVMSLILEQGADIEAKDNQGMTPLFIAAKRKRADIIQFLVANGANIQATDNSGKTILHRLVEEKAPIPLLHWFFRNGIEINSRDAFGETALHLAVSSRLRDVIIFLLKNQADTDICTDEGLTPLHSAVDQHDVDESIVTLLLDLGADVAAQTNDWKQALHMSAARGHETVMQLLLDAGADPNAMTRDGTTALHTASSKGNASMVRSLLDRGADVNAQTKEGITALHLSAMEDRPNVIDILLKAGADPKIQTKTPYDQRCKGSTPLHFAVGNCSTVEHLLKHGGEIETKNYKGETVFFQAAYSAETMRRLAELGADINTTNNRGETVLHKNAESTEMVATLLGIGVRVDTRNSAGETALHLAARGYSGVLKLLLDHGADANTTDAKGRTALHRAASWSNGHEASMQILVEMGADLEIRDKNGKTALDLFRRSRRDTADIKSVISRLAAI